MCNPLQSLPVGTCCSRNVACTAQELRDEFDIDMRVPGIMSSERMLLSETAIDLEHWRERFDRCAATQCGFLLHSRTLAVAPVFSDARLKKHRDVCVGSAHQGLLLALKDFGRASWLDAELDPD